MSPKFRKFDVKADVLVKNWPHIRIDTFRSNVTDLSVTI